MEINEFIKDFGNQFDDEDVSLFNPQTEFRGLEEWSSMNAFAVLNMVWKKYDAPLKPDEMKNTNTIQELFDLVKELKMEKDK